MKKKLLELLVQSALEAREQSYAPYSSFSVGAAILCEDGSVYTGANIECASYSATVCAERVALFQAVHHGKRRFSAIAVVGGKAGEALSSFCPPCGVCRQVMAEFCGDDFEILLYDGKDVKRYTLNELFPVRFALSDEKGGDPL